MPLLTPAGNLPASRRSPSCRDIRTLSLRRRASSAPRSWGICSARSRASTNSTGCDAPAAGSSSRTASSTLMISMTGAAGRDLGAACGSPSRFVAPIRRLIAAAQEVSRGNLKVELPEQRGEGDLRRLSTTFNTMTREIEASARRARDGQRAAARPPPLHGGGAVGRLGGRHRSRQPGSHHARHRARPSSCCRCRKRTWPARRSRTSCPCSAPALEKREEPHHKSRGSQENRRHDRRRGAGVCGARDARAGRARRRRVGGDVRRRDRARRPPSAPRPGPTWRAASRTRSRIR